MGAVSLFIKIFKAPANNRTEKIASKTLGKGCFIKKTGRSIKKIRYPRYISAGFFVKTYELTKTDM